MKRIQYRVTFDSSKWGARKAIVTVDARTIDSGARKALAKALSPLFQAEGEEFHSIEFWQVLSP